MAERVIAGAGLAWLAMGLRRVARSPLLRRDPIAWLTAAANVAAIHPLLVTAYQ